VLLQRGYAAGDLSQVYPLARATGPVLAVALAALTLGQDPEISDLLGGAVITVAVVSLAGRPQTAPGAAVWYALATGALIAGYTVWDAYGVNALSLSVVTYYWGAEVARALLLAPIALRRPQTVRMAWRRARRAVLGVGVLSPLAYMLVLAALRIAPVSVVAPAREISIAGASSRWN
jgi:drug/metabolite transporter (DMT)-like permease